MQQDLFQKWLDKNIEHYALKDKSYKNYYDKPHEKYEGQVNTDLATLGDAVLKICLCKILFEKLEKGSKFSEIKKEYETDKILVKSIAKNYDLIKYLKYDKNDSNKPNDYDYLEEHSKPYKYIATPVEACLGAIYLEDCQKENSFERVLEIVQKWKDIIDEYKKISIQ